MKEELTELLNECVENGNEADFIVLKQMLQGVRRKQDQHNGSYIGAALAMERTNGEDTCEVTIPVTPLTYNSLEIVHGGITATLVDSAMGTLANILLPEGYGAVTTNLTIHYLAPGKTGSLTAKASLVHKGSKTLVIDGKVVSDDGKTVAHCTGSFFVVKKRF
ncbi:PaaI family thioesterase [Rossellomorea vietnamensis]|uniref:PaaI family thioesterase n=2 Tax=Rossellomorea TaxID=2837508 RepID=A0A5D4KLD2_9BACI|nr:MULTISPECIES: PaaI family thioesterase [Rossellomorea]TYR77646.1 PaaI family thioesterase [Rossellomorea vietnamensis]TYS77122.1 PaaI family thioesterase [Rossellomorea aquimaris]